MSKRVSRFWFLLVFLLILVSCKERIEGCKDIEATNYNVSADDPCSDCCIYPKMLLEVYHKYDSLNFSFDSTYIIAGDTVRFKQVIFYLSDFRLVNSTDSIETVETIDLDIIGGDIVTFKDDFTLVSRSISSFSYKVGEIKGTGEFNTLKFSVGLVGESEFANAEAVIDGHPLSLTSDTLWTYPEGYVFNRVIVIPDTSNILEVRQIDIKGEVNLVEVSLPFSIDLELGFDATIPLRIDYKKWFSDIDFKAGAIEDIRSKIVNQTPNVFSINE
jgi:methanobactin biosynthesis MbnP-like protein